MYLEICTTLEYLNHIHILSLLKLLYVANSPQLCSYLHVRVHAYGCQYVAHQFAFIVAHSVMCQISTSA